MGCVGIIENQGVGMIIGICGLIGAGKDTVADYLVNVHEFRRESFAGTLKDAVAHVFGWDRIMLEGRTKTSRAWREMPDPWWSDRLGMTVTPRWILQYWGTEVCRQGFHDDIWIASLENKLRTATDNVVISDCRFPNEITAIRNQGGYVVRVLRGQDPEWYQWAVHANNGDTESVDILARFGIHPSETAWIGTDFDAVLNNDGSMDQLYQQVTDLVQDLHASKLIVA